MHVHITVHVHVHVGDEEPSSEDVLSESADEIPVGGNEAAHVSDEDSSKDDVHVHVDESTKRLSTEAETFQFASNDDGMAGIVHVCLFSPKYMYMYKQ